MLNLERLFDTTDTECGPDHKKEHHPNIHHVQIPYKFQFYNLEGKFIKIKPTKILNEMCRHAFFILEQMMVQIYEHGEAFGFS